MEMSFEIYGLHHFMLPTYKAIEQYFSPRFVDLKVPLTKNLYLFYSFIDNRHGDRVVQSLATTDPETECPQTQRLSIVDSDDDRPGG